MICETEQFPFRGNVVTRARARAELVRKFHGGWEAGGEAERQRVRQGRWPMESVGRRERYFGESRTGVSTEGAVEKDAHTLGP